MTQVINYDIVADFEKIHNMTFNKTCVVTNLMNGITKRYNTRFILENFTDADNITYQTNHLWRRKYADLDIYIEEDGVMKYWARIQAERNKESRRLCC